MFTTAEKLAIKSQIAALEMTVTNLKALLNENSSNTIKEKKEKVVITSMTEAEKSSLAKEILTKSKLVTDGTATQVSISYLLQKNEGHDVPFLNRNKLAVSIFNKEGEVIASNAFNKNTFSSMYAQLAFLGVFTYHQDHSATVVTLNL